MYDVTDPAILTAYEMNLFHFSAGKTMAEVQMLNELFRRAGSYQEFLALASKELEVFNKQWLETEYNTAVLTGEAAATYNRLIKQADIFPYWEYRTMGDNHVRDEHEWIHGLILPANSPLWDQLFPPNGWNCRCYILPRMKSDVTDVDLKMMEKRAENFIKSSEFQKAKAQGWGVNRGKTAEIFTANQQYIYKQPNLSSRKLNALKPSDYGLQSYSNARKVATDPSPIYTGSAGDFYSAQELMGDQTILRDWKNRQLLLEAKGFQRHTSGKRADRVKLLTAMRDTLSQPDEVWLRANTGNESGQMVYLKYYQDQTLVVIGDISGSSLKLESWFTLEEIKEQISKYRKGILIKS